jgi:CheY-like chemotaxis protein
VASKRALIVDDSKSARVVLSRMLQKYSIEVDTAESAERAIEYLVQNRPDVIFMDHLMPGMDGFQAVQAIKNNPRTATIPIMMYTSQEGELYVGQARALGAVGVLPKLVRPVDVSKILYQLHLLPERRDPTPPAFVPGNAAAAAVTQQVQETRTDYAKTAAGLVPADWHPQLESALRNHDAELRRFMVASLDTYADRVVGDIRNQINETPALQLPPLPPPRQPPYLWIAALIAALIPGFVLGLFYSRVLETNRMLTAEQGRLQAANTELKTQVGRLSEINALRALAPTAITAGEGNEALAGPSDIGMKRVEPVPYGEVPLAGVRLETLREMLATLQQREFRGVIRIESFAGRFCLQGNASEGFNLAPAELAASKCTTVGNPFDEALAPAQRQSLAFANFARGLPQATAGAITVTTASGGDVAAEPYPPSAAVATAGEWNAIAARNNRVEFSALAAP